MRRALPIGLLVLVVAAGPAAASTGTARVRSVSAPHTATAGMPVDVTARMAGRGRASREAHVLPLGDAERRARGHLLALAGSGITANYRWKLVPDS
jgi:hypothetical protein